MDYSPQAFDALVAEVESQGGALLPDPCVPLDIKFEAPPYSKAGVQRRATCGCKNESRLVTVYEPGKGNRQSGSGFITACAVCDAVGAWPRYCEAVYAADPSMDICQDEEDDDPDAA